MNPSHESDLSAIVRLGSLTFEVWNLLTTPTWEPEAALPLLSSSAANQLLSSSLPVSLLFFLFLLTLSLSLSLSLSYFLFSFSSCRDSTSSVPLANPRVTAFQLIFFLVSVAEFSALLPQTPPALCDTICRARSFRVA
ncbi:hypothetical protein P175DRAFT_0378559 [Aspergillus ochraceoroseus IBT 24754]|uniref:Uncharacterized protein n=1 Tax=Aspergillus ochraceoroseus IBT 24754 TaxID=1392256 RepID=A0A2T5LNG2_9EURO|nr:uncharacterized protein P175DRAFT_0378559 [Aspergillus ochraceoroseus IBT 24754]PTU17812.1 hypothetical protein P175DRAFT_0378559 [Aspergillus ochraceoroseus IBT 24754]